MTKTRNHLRSFLQIFSIRRLNRKTFQCILCIVLVLSTSSCKKEYSLETHGLLPTKDAFQNFLVTASTFKLSAFYSDTPIDWDPYDTVGPKTDLWQYVRDYLKDDTLEFFPNNIATIHQGQNLIYTGSPQSFNVGYNIRTDSVGNVLFDFVDYDYQPFTYNLQNFNDTSIVVYIKTADATLFTRYSRIY